MSWSVIMSFSLIVVFLLIYPPLDEGSGSTLAVIMSWVPALCCVRVASPPEPIELILCGSYIAAPVYRP
jgi:hypothetical protein